CSGGGCSSPRYCGSMKKVVNKILSKKSQNSMRPSSPQGFAQRKMALARRVQATIDLLSMAATLACMSRDPVELEIFKNLYHSIAEEMGAALRRTSFSPNIKERRDYSCAVFDGDGEVIAMGDHMPVHLGSMPMSVRAAVETCEMGPGDVVML